MIVARLEGEFVIVENGISKTGTAAIRVHAERKEFAARHGMSPSGGYVSDAPVDDRNVSPVSLRPCTTYWSTSLRSTEGVTWYPVVRWRGIRLYDLYWDWRRPYPFVTCFADWMEIPWRPLLGIDRPAQSDGARMLAALAEAQGEGRSARADRDGITFTLSLNDMDLVEGPPPHSAG